MSVFIVAEAGVNHLGDRAKMLALCDAAKEAGADAIKVQAYNAEELVKRRGKGDLALLKQCELSDADLDAIAAHCKAIGIKWFASVFDPLQVERVLSRGACALKIGHAEWDWWELYHACHRGLSDRKLYRTHMIWVSRQNVSTISSNSGPQWLHGRRGNVLCVSEYPADGNPPHLGWIKDGGISGFSSHYTDYRIPAAAALRGAEYIEAHIMTEAMSFDPGGCPEHNWSLNPDDFGKMVKLIREYETWL